MPLEARRRSRASHGAGVIGGCELPDLGAGSWKLGPFAVQYELLKPNFTTTMFLNFDITLIFNKTKIMNTS